MREIEEKTMSTPRGSGAREGPPPRNAHPARRVALIVAFLVVAFAALFAFGYRSYLQRLRLVETEAGAEAGTLNRVNVEKVRRAPETTVLSLPGNIAPVTEAYIYARASGYVRRRNVDIGDRLQAGQLLAEIDAPELDQQVQQARAASAQAQKLLDQAKADLVEARSRQELARVTWDRYKVLVEHGAVSRQEGDQQLAAFKSTSAAVDAAEARVGSADNNVQASRANLERLVALQEYEKVRAPFSGVITARNFDVGALISASGASQGQGPGTGPGALGPSSGAQGGELFRIAQIGVLRVLINVPESDAPGVRVGQAAIVTLQAFPKRQFEGRVTRTANAVDVSSRTMLTEIRVQNPEQLLLPGMYVTVQLVSPRRDPPLLVPGGSVMTSARGLSVAVLVDLQPDESRARSYPSGAKRVHLQAIQVGRDNGQDLEVLGGLQGWEYIVLNPGDEIVEGAAVLPVAAPREAAPAKREGRR